MQGAQAAIDMLAQQGRTRVTGSFPRRINAGSIITSQQQQGNRAEYFSAAWQANTQESTKIWKDQIKSGA